jgi:hypothetical protein
VGLRLALAHPERVTAIISQNGNAYEEGLSQGWNPIQKYWKEPTPDNRTALRDFLTPEATKSQYLYGVHDETQVASEAYQLDSALLARPGNDEIQLDLFLDYASKSRSTRSSRSTSVQNGRHCLRSGVRTTRSFCRPGLRRSSVITRTPKYTSTTPVTSRWKRIIAKLPTPFGSSSIAS